MEFPQYIIQLWREKDYILGQIWNANQTPVYFDMLSRTTVAAKGSKDARLLTKGNVPLRCCAAQQMHGSCRRT